MVRIDSMQVLTPSFVYFAEPEGRTAQVSTSSVPTTSLSLLYSDDKDLPIFEAGKREHYTIKETVKILLMDNEKKCSKTSLQVRRNLSFLVDVGIERLARCQERREWSLSQHVKSSYVDSGSRC